LIESTSTQFENLELNRKWHCAIGSAQSHRPTSSRRDPFTTHVFGPSGSAASTVAHLLHSCVMPALDPHPSPPHRAYPRRTPTPPSSFSLTAHRVNPHLLPIFLYASAEMPPSGSLLICRSRRTLPATSKRAAAVTPIASCPLRSSENPLPRRSLRRCRRFRPLPVRDDPEPLFLPFKLRFTSSS
jgi:hypothetical protein